MYLVVTILSFLPSISVSRLSLFPQGIFDEALLKWAPRAPSPNVLVVSHGMLLHEIFLYLAEEQACDMKGKDDAVKAKFCCNTGVTRFRVSLDADTGDTGKAYALSCVEFNNDDHLKEP